MPTQNNNIMTYKEQIQHIWNSWNEIHNEKQWNQWSNQVKNSRFGTYGTISIFEVIQNVEFQFPSILRKHDFLNEVRDALNGVQL